jgi:hypothetical protein
MDQLQLLTQLAKESKGASFVHADLHIHSYGGSHDVKEVAMTPEAIVKMAADEKLSLIVVTSKS